MAAKIPESTEHEHFQHAPETTLLQRELTKGLMRVERYTNHILIGLLVIAILGVGYILWQRSQISRQTAGWTAFEENRAPEDYLALAEKYPNAPVGDWSRLQAARMFASEGLVQALTNRSASDASLKNAKEAYDVLLKKKSLQPEIRQEALYGLATCLEALSNGENKPAIDAYEALLKEFPQSPHRLWAESRVKALKTNNAEDFYAWFRKQDPKPVDRSGPNDIPSLKDLIPDLEIEDAKEAEKPADGAQAPAVPEAGAEKGEMPAKPAAEFPADAPKPALPAPAEKPAPETAADKPKEEMSKDEKPAAEKPTEEKPAEEKKAAEDKPAAEEKPAETPAPAPEAPAAEAGK